MQRAVEVGELGWNDRIVDIFVTVQKYDARAEGFASSPMVLLGRRMPLVPDSAAEAYGFTSNRTIGVRSLHTALNPAY